MRISIEFLFAFRDIVRLHDNGPANFNKGYRKGKDGGFKFEGNADFPCEISRKIAEKNENLANLCKWICKVEPCDCKKKKHQKLLKTIKLLTPILVPDYEPCEELKEDEVPIFRMALALDQARRTVKSYYENILALKQAGTSEKLLRIAAEKGPLLIYFTLIEHLEYLINENYSSASFEKIMELTADTYKKKLEKDE